MFKQIHGQTFFNGNTLIIEVKDNNSLYAYDVEQNTVNLVGDKNNNMKQIKNQVAFYDNVLLYTNGSKIDIKKANGETYKDEWYNLNDNSIAGISMLDSTKMQIARYDENGVDITRSIIVDLSNGSTTEMEDSVYTDVIKLK